MKTRLERKLSQTRRYAPDFVETLTARLLTEAKRSGFFSDAIEDAKRLQEDEGYAWDVALSISCSYWCR